MYVIQACYDSKAALDVDIHRFDGLGANENLYPPSGPLQPIIRTFVTKITKQGIVSKVHTGVWTDAGLAARMARTVGFQMHSAPAHVLTESSYQQPSAVGADKPALGSVQATE